jgi:hypothetical protein
MGNARWRRLTEERAGVAKSVFHFDVQGSVAKSTHAGIPWLRFIRERHGSRVHFWPFDGWVIPAGRSAVAEVYPALWSRTFACEARNPDQHDAYCISAWLSRADRDSSLVTYLQARPCGPPADQVGDHRRSVRSGRSTTVFERGLSLDCPIVGSRRSPRSGVARQICLRESCESLSQAGSPGSCRFRFG